MTAMLAHSMIESYQRNGDNEYSINQEVYRRLLSLCDLVDMLVFASCAESITLRVLPPQTQATITVYSNELELPDSRDHRLFDCFQDSDYVRLSKSLFEQLQLELGVRDLWEKS